MTTRSIPPHGTRILPGCLRSWRRAAAAGLLIGALATGWVSEAPAEFFRYRDDQGRTHYVDDLGKVPERYREDLHRYREKTDRLSDQERLLLIRQERRQEQEKQAAERAMREKRALEQYLKSLQTPVVIENHRVMVPVRLGYRGRETETVLVLDTGASIVALYQEVADRLVIDDYQEATIRVFGGGTLQTRIAALDYIRVGPFEKRNIQVGIVAPTQASPGYQGLLGMNFLRGLDYSIDFENQLIRWQPPRE